MTYYSAKFIDSITNYTSTTKKEKITMAIMEDANYIAQLKNNKIIYKTSDKELAKWNISMENN